MKRVIVAGSRDYTDSQILDTVVHEHRPDVIVHGGARGADALAGDFAQWHLVPTEVHPVTSADWRRHGKKAGPMRNQRMVDAGADVCLAFPHADSVGTWDCAARAMRAGIFTVIDGAHITEADMVRGLQAAREKLAREPDHAERVAKGRRRKS